MKGKLSTLVILVSLFIISAGAFAMDKDPEIQHGPRFVDLNNDGYNDNAPDADGDGIPNGQDEDYVPAGQQNGSSNNGTWTRGRRFQNRTNVDIGPNFIDADGDGVCDNFGQGKMLGKRGNGNGMRQHMMQGRGQGAGRGQSRRGPRG